jgi:hypothetical protein
MSKAKLLVLVGILNSVAEETGIVTTLTFKLLLGSGVLFRALVLCVSASIFATEVYGHDNLEDERHAHQAKKDEVTSVELGRVFLEVDEGSEDTAEVTETDVHGDTDTTLSGTTNVVTVPGDTLRDVGVNATGKEEDTGILDVGVIRADLENNTEHGGEGEPDHEDTASAQFVGKVSTSDAAEASNNVRRNAHELSLIVGVAKGLDDGRQEERETVERGVDAEGDEHVHPDLPVLDGVHEVLGTVLVCERAAVLFQTAGDLLLLDLGQELGGLRVVVHVEESYDGNEEGKKTFKNEDPSPSWKAADALQFDDTSCKQTAEGASASCCTEEDGQAETTFVTTVPHGDVCIFESVRDIQS